MRSLEPSKATLEMRAVPAKNSLVIKLGLRVDGIRSVILTGCDGKPKIPTPAVGLGMGLFELP
jgi:hypothetical protein